MSNLSSGGKSMDPRSSSILWLLPQPGAVGVNPPADAAVAPEGHYPSERLLDRNAASGFPATSPTPHPAGEATEAAPPRIAHPSTSPSRSGAGTVARSA